MLLEIILTAVLFFAGIALSGYTIRHILKLKQEGFLFSILVGCMGWWALMEVILIPMTMKLAAFHTFVWVYTAAAGGFGKLSHGSIHVRWNRNQNYYDQAPWRGKWASDGGALMNQCIHGIDLLRWMFGDEVEEVYGSTRQQFHHYLEAEDVGMAVVKFKNGAIATIEGTTNVYPQNLEETLYIFGETGTVKIGGKSTNNIDVWDFADETEMDSANKHLEEATSNVYGNGHTSLYADMIDAIQKDRKPYVDAVAGRNALEMVLAIYKSQKDGMPVKLPLTNFKSTDMTGEFSEN